MQNKLKNVLLCIILLLQSIGSRAQIFQWAQQFGGLGYALSYSFCNDSVGNIYSVGVFNGTIDFDPGPQVNNLYNFVAGQMTYISKLDSNGNFIFAKELTTGLNNLPHCIKMDHAGNLLITGRFFDSTDFDPGPGVLMLGPQGDYDIFVVKLNSSGDLIWAKTMGGGNPDNGSSIGIDANDNIYVAGNFKGSVDFDPGPGIFNLTSSSNYDNFILKLNSAGNFVWAVKTAGHINNEPYCGDIAMDNAGNCLLTGWYNGTVDFDPGPGVVNLTSAGNDDIFLVKYDSNGNLIFAKSMGSTYKDHALDIVIDVTDNIIITGMFQLSVDFDPGPSANILTYQGGADLFISKYDTNGNLIWAGGIGGSLTERGKGLATDAFGNIYCVGTFMGTVDFDPGPGIFNLSNPANGSNAFILKLNPNGIFKWAGGLLGPDQVDAEDISVDAAGQIMCTGSFRKTTDFDPGLGIYNMDASPYNSDNSFLLKWTQCQVNTSISINGSTLTAQQAGAIYQWKHCGESNSIIAGATNQSYTPPVSGNYAVIITVGTCTDSSECKFVSMTSVNDAQMAEKYFLYPNPVTDVLHIDLNIEPINSIRVYDIYGKAVQHETSKQFSVKNLATGIYILKIDAVGKKYIARFLKE